MTDPRIKRGNPNEPTRENESATIARLKAYQSYIRDSFEPVGLASSPRRTQWTSPARMPVSQSYLNAFKQAYDKSNSKVQIGGKAGLTQIKSRPGAFSVSQPTSAKKLKSYSSRGQPRGDSNQNPERQLSPVELADQTLFGLTEPAQKTSRNDAIYYKNMQLQRCGSSINQHKEFRRLALQKLQSFRVSGKSKEIVDRMIGEGRYVNLIEQSAQACQCRRAYDKVELEDGDGEVERRKGGLAAGSAFKEFMQRNEAWCQEVRGRQIAKLNQKIQVEIKKGVKEETEPRRDTAGQVLKENSMRAVLRRKALLEKELQETPFRPRLKGRAGPGRQS